MLSCNLVKLIDTVNAQHGVFVRKADSFAICPKLSSLFFDIVDQIEAFIFAPKNEYPVDIEESECFFDAPFKNFSLEVLGMAITVSHANEPECDIECISVHEKEPNVFVIFILYKFKGSHYVFAEDATSELATSLNPLILEFTKRISSESSGTEKVNQRTKLKFNGVKKLLKLKRLIHIAPKTQKEKYGNNIKRAIDWSSRWTQRGHWRELDSTLVGKDRCGVYCIQGKTWVVEGVKGPKDKPLIRKTRVVEYEV